MIGVQAIGLAPIGTGALTHEAGAPASVVGPRVGWFEFDALASSVGSVVIDPVAPLAPGELTREFIGTVLGEGPFDPALDWTSTKGVISSTGGLTLEETLTPLQVQVTATSVQDPRKFATITVTQLPAVLAPVVLGIIITPPTAFIAGGESVQFFAEVVGENNPSQGVAWGVDLGGVDVNGRVTAPAATLAIQQGTLTATSQEDPEISASINFNVLPLLMAFTPSAARTVRILPGRSAFAVGSHWSLGSAGPVGAKDPNSTIDIPFDWSAWLADIGNAQLAKVEFFLSGNLQQEGVIPSATGGTVLVSGGTPKGTATITCRITTATTPSRTDDRTVVLQIGDQ